jgi:hypothetical protein
MRKAMTAAAALAGMLALAAVPVLGADQSVTPAQAAKQPDTAKVPDTAKTTAPATEADPAKAADPAKPADPAQPTDAAKKEQEKKNPNALSKNQYGGGFRLTTEDNRFSLRLFAAIQFRYTYMDYDADVNGNQEDYSNFFIRRARLWWDGHAYSQKFTYYFHVQLEPSSSVNLHDAWASYALHPMFTVGAGRNKIAYGLEFLNSGFGLSSVERSIMYGETDIMGGGGLSRFPGGGTENFVLSGEDASTGFPVGGLSLFRSQGVQLSGQTKGKGPVFEYQVGVWQGRNSKGASNPADDHLYSARVGFYPNGWINWLQQGDVGNSQKFLFGVLGSAYADTTKHRANAAGQAVPVYNGKDRGLNLALETRYRGFSSDVEIGTETYKLEDSNVIGDREFDRFGWRAQFGYFLKPRTVEVIGRYAEIERLKDPTVEAVMNSGLGFAKVKNAAGVFQEAVEKKMTETTFGVNWYLSGAAHQHKIFVDFTRLSREFAGFVTAGGLGASAPDQNDSRVRAMLQLKF